VEINRVRKHSGWEFSLAVRPLAYTWNPASGCHGSTCEVYRKGVCWARRIVRRLGRYCWRCPSFEPHLHPERLDEPLKLQRPAAIAPVTTGDIFGLNVHHTSMVVEAIGRAWLHVFPALTKLPNCAQPLISTGTITIPENFMFGVTVNSQEDVWRLRILEEIEAPLRWVCFEPLYGPIDYDLSWLDWIVIGPQTRPTLQPRREWVDGILEGAGGRVPIYMKSKLDHPEAPYNKEGPRILDITRMIFERR